MLSNWVPFFFESNQSWGMCNTPEDWLLVKKNYLEYWSKHGGLDLNKIRLSDYCDPEKVKSGIHFWNFGARREHNGDYTLAEFAKDNNMTL